MVHSTRLESVQAQAYVGSNPTSSAVEKYPPYISNSSQQIRYLSETLILI